MAILVQPFVVTEAALVSTDVEEIEQDFDEGRDGGYATNDKVVVEATNSVYQALIDMPDNPVPYPPDNADKWLNIGPSNKWALFDKAVGTKTSQADSFTYTIQVTGRANAISFLAAQATSIHVVVEIAASETEWDTVYDNTVGMVSTVGITDWYAYFFNDIELKTSVSLLDLPTYLDPRITFTVEYGEGTASVGTVIIGYQKFLGNTQYGSSAGITDYSVKNTDQFGTTTVVERPYADISTLVIMTLNTSIDQVKQLLARYRATPVLVIGSPDIEATTVYGFYRSFAIDIQYSSESQLTLEMEGLT